MKVAFFTDAYYPRINGVVVSVQSYARELCRLGHEACVICPNYDTRARELSVRPDTEEPSLLEVRVPAAREVFSKEDRAVSLLHIKRMDGWLSGWKPDVIHVNTEFTVGVLGVRYAKRHALPLVYTFHTLWEDYFANYIHVVPPSMLKWGGRRLVKAFLRRADEIVVPTVHIQETVARYGIERECHVIPTGIPDFVAQDIGPSRMDEFRTRLYAEYPQLAGRRILLYVGRMAVEKNLDLLLSVLEIVRHDAPDAVLLFVGGGPELEPLRERAVSRGLSSSVLFAGYRDRGELPLFYRAAHVFVFPSTTETQGLVTVEAMLSGLPVVAVGEMGTVDVMQGDNGGFMVRNDASAFAEKTGLLLRDEALRSRKSAEAAGRGREWLISSLTPRLVTVYQKALRRT